jgi:protein CpxP
MSKVNWLTGAVVVLLLLNITLLAVLYRSGSHRPGPPRGEGPKRLVVERLHFDADQVAAYEALIAEHQEAIRLNDRAMMAARNSLYANLQTQDAVISDSLFATIATIQRNIEQVHFAHFADIRALCRPDQLHHFETLSKDLAEVFAQRHPPNHR